MSAPCERRPITGDLVFGAVVAGLFALLVLRVVPGLLEGRLVDTDSYMRLVRVRRLAESWAWFDGTIARSNAPFGETLHWTRPVDVLLLMVGGLLRPFMGFDRALHVSGVVLSPLLLIATCFVTAWSVRPLAGAGVRTYTMIAVLAQAGAMGYALPGRADHHMLILLVFVAMHGCALRMLLEESASRWGWATGAWAGLGLWISTEFLVPLGVLLIATGLAWVLRGGDLAARARSMAVGLVAVTTAAIVVEHAPATLGIVEFDRISVVHLLAVGLVLLFWTGAATGAATKLGRAGRAAYGVGVAALCAGVVYAVVPRFFGGPMVDVDPELRTGWLPYLTEYQPFLVPHDVADVGRIFAYLGSALVALGAVAHGLTADRGGRRVGAWVLLGIGLATFVPLGIRWVRFVMYAELLGVLGTMVVLARAMAALEARRRRGGGALMRASVAAALIAGPLLLGAAVMVAGGGSGAELESAAATQTESCSVERLVAALTDPEGLGARPRVVLAHVDLGPVLLYRTPHSVVATPYHRNARGILDAGRIFSTTDPREARRLMEERGVDVVIPCGVEAPATAAAAPPTFVTLLRAGAPPAWLVPAGPPDSGVWELAVDPTPSM